MSVVNDFDAQWATLPARTRLLVLLAAAVVGFVAAYHLAIAPLTRSTRALEARHAENSRKLARIEGESTRPQPPSAFAGKRLGELSAARVVEALTQAAHQSGIQRITFKTGPPAAVTAAAGEEVPQENVARMPVKVEIEAQGGDFAAYLDNLGKLPIPIAVETFEMKVDEALDPALRIRMELEVYGKPS